MLPENLWTEFSFILTIFSGYFMLSPSK